MHRLYRLHTSLKGNINSQQTRLNLELKREKIYHVHNESIPTKNIGLVQNKLVVSDLRKERPGSILNSNSRTFRSKQQNLLQPKKRKRRKWPKLAKLYCPQNTVPKRIEPLPDIKPIIKPPASLTQEAQREAQKEAKANFIQWLKDNAGVIILNFGSIASFISFTRTDILELRLLSITGSLSSICYFALRPPPIVIGPIIWSSIFAGTNAYMVYHIYEERKGEPKQMSAEEQDVYEEHMLPHHVTPRQFEKMLLIVKKRELKEGEVLVHKGQTVDKVHLVVSGSTEAYSCQSSQNANIARRVTAASSKFGNKEKLLGGDSGAWVGELAFLNYLSERDQAKGTGIPTPNIALLLGEESDESNEANSKEDVNSKKAATGKAFLNYVATEKTIVYEWDFEELAELMQTSSDLRSAVTRAMTAAVVGKVVNMYISKADAELPIWKWIAGKFSETKDNISAIKINLSPE